MSMGQAEATWTPQKRRRLGEAGEHGIIDPFAADDEIAERSTAESLQTIYLFDYFANMDLLRANDESSNEEEMNSESISEGDVSASGDDSDVESEGLGGSRYAWPSSSPKSITLALLISNDIHFIFCTRVFPLMTPAEHNGREGDGGVTRWSLMRSSPTMMTTIPLNIHFWYKVEKVVHPLHRHRKTTECHSATM
jgi:hypothetical protein